MDIAEGKVKVSNFGRSPDGNYRYALFVPVNVIRTFDITPNNRPRLNYKFWIEEIPSIDATEISEDIPIRRLIPDMDKELDFKNKYKKFLNEGNQTMLVYLKVKATKQFGRNNAERIIRKAEEEAKLEAIK